MKNISYHYLIFKYYLNYHKLQYFKSNESMVYSVNDLILNYLIKYDVDKSSVFLSVLLCNGLWPQIRRPPTNRPQSLPSTAARRHSSSHATTATHTCPTRTHPCTHSRTRRRGQLLSDCRARSRSIAVRASGCGWRRAGGCGRLGGTGTGHQAAQTSRAAARAASSAVLTEIESQDAR